MAAEKGVLLELSARGGHNMANGLVASLARLHGCGLLVNSDAHAPGDLLTPERQKRVALGAGLNFGEFMALMRGADSLVKSLAAYRGRY
jgi:histidinol phosphatase-like PHP family hydrolase